MCVDASQQVCDAAEIYQWCADGAETACGTTTTTTNLEPAAIAAIAATPVLLIAAAAGRAL